MAFSLGEIAGEELLAAGAAEAGEGVAAADAAASLGEGAAVLEATAVGDGAASGISEGVLAASKSLALSFVVGKLFAPSVSLANGGSAQTFLANTLSNMDPIPVIYGSRRVGASVIEVGLTSTLVQADRLHRIAIWGEGPISAVQALYLDTVAYTDPNRFPAGVVGTPEHYLGTDTQAATPTLIAFLGDPNKWNANCTLSGVAYTYVSMVWNPSAFTHGRPVMTADIDGRLLYDPRSGSTAFSRNPALAIRDYLTAARYGRGVPASMIDDASFISAANTCDEAVTVPDGAGGTTTQARYTCDGVLNVDQSPLDNLRALLTSCRGFVVFSGGQYKLKIDRIEPITASNGFESSSWVAGTAAPAGYGLNQDIAGESTFAVRAGPYGASEVVNVCQSLDTPPGDPGPDGGWTMSNVIPVDKTKSHLFACFFKRLSSGTITGAQAYLGLHSNSASDVLDLAGTSNTNPYFLAFGVAAFMPQADKWYLAVGFVHENGYGTVDTNISGVYDPATGMRVVVGTEYKWPADSTLVGHRAYHYYNQTISGEVQQMARPVVIQCTAALAPNVIARLLAGPVQSGGFALSTDNIIGGWSIQLGGKRNRFNRVKARFFNKDASWQPDYAVYEDLTHRAQDAGQVLEQELDLPYTRNVYTAAQIAQIEEKRSRYGTLVSLTATIAATALEVGDVVPVAHATPGWPAAGDPAAGKLFRVLEMELLSSDEVRLTLLEYQASVYSLTTPAQVSAPAATSLPDLSSVAAPGAPSVTESLYQTQTSAGFKSRATVTWSSANDAFVQSGGWYQLERSPAGAGTWTVYGPIASPGSGTVSYIQDDVAPGSYDFRVAAFNSIGAKSAYSPTTTQQFVGLNAPPSNITNFLVQSLAGQAKFTWDRASSVTDLAVLVSGRVFVRWSPKVAGASWDYGSLINPDGYPGDTSIGFGPLLTGTYMAKFWNGRSWSVTEAVYVVTEALLTGLATLATVTESPTFAGTKSNVVVTDGGIQLDGTTLIDSMLTNIDTWAAIDSLGGVQGSGSYSFSSKMDLGSVKSARLFSSIDSRGFSTDDLMDSRTDPIDSWGLIDGDPIEDAEATLMVRTTQTDPNASPVWTAFERLGHVADYSARGFDFRLDFVTAAPTHNRTVTGLSVAAKQ